MILEAWSVLRRANANFAPSMTRVTQACTSQRLMLILDLVEDPKVMDRSDGWWLKTKKCGSSWGDAGKDLLSVGRRWTF